MSSPAPGGGTRLIGKLGGRDLAVTLEIPGGDPLGALARASNYILDRVPGELMRVTAEVDNGP